MTALQYMWLWVRTRPAVRLAVTRTVAAMRHTAARQNADEREVARLTVEWPPARDDLADSPWSAGSPHLHWVGRPIANHRCDETATTSPKYLARHHEMRMAALVRALLAPTQEFAGIVGSSYTTQERAALIIDIPEMVRGA